MSEKLKLNKITLTILFAGMSLLACKVVSNEIGNKLENLEIVEEPYLELAFEQVNVGGGKNVSASSSSEGHSPEMVVDGNYETYWQASEREQKDFGTSQELNGSEENAEIEGKYPWLILDLGTALDIFKIELIYYQAGSGDGVHQLFYKGPFGEDKFILAKEFKDIFNDGDTLIYEPGKTTYGIQYIKIVTIHVLEDFGWREISIIPTTEDPFGDLQTDTDGDGLPDIQDWCPNTPGSVEYNGC